MLTFAQELFEQWRNKADQRVSLISISLPIVLFPFFNYLFFNG
jgi:hypothetical protein